jgi:serine/threonine protein kinase
MKSIGKDFLILNELDEGATSKVYLVKSIKNGETYAAKIYNEPSNCYLNEIEMLERLSSLNNNNIINLISYGEDYIENNGIQENEKKNYIILDYLPNKDLFLYITNIKETNENDVKQIFSKILKAVEYCHNKGICHRDLKLENIMLDKNNEPVLCDFGLSTYIENNNGYLTEYVGTKMYMSPEIIRNEPYSGIKCDIFSLGVILFSLMFQKFGFLEASRNDPFYNLIRKKKYDEYWFYISQQVGIEKVKKVSNNFKELYLKMVSYNPNERPSIKDILYGKWMNNI